MGQAFKTLFAGLMTAMLVASSPACLCAVNYSISISGFEHSAGLSRQSAHHSSGGSAVASQSAEPCTPDPSNCEHCDQTPGIKTSAQKSFVGIVAVSSIDHAVLTAPVQPNTALRLTQDARITAGTGWLHARHQSPVSLKVLMLE